MRDEGVCVQYLVWQIFGWISVNIGNNAMRALSQWYTYTSYSCSMVLCKVVVQGVDVFTGCMSVY